MIEISIYAPESRAIHGPRRPPFAFDNSYARLPERFFARLAPTPAPASRFMDRLRQAMAAGRKGRQKPQDGLRET
jgi:hypothetical protein